MRYHGILGDVLLPEARRCLSFLRVHLRGCDLQTNSRSRSRCTFFSLWRYVDYMPFTLLASVGRSLLLLLGRMQCFQTLLIFPSAHANHFRCFIPASHRISPNLHRSGTVPSYRMPSGGTLTVSWDSKLSNRETHYERYLHLP